MIMYDFILTQGVQSVLVFNALKTIFDLTWWYTPLILSNQAILIGPLDKIRMLPQY